VLSPVVTDTVGRDPREVNRSRKPGEVICMGDTEARDGNN